MSLHCLLPAAGASSRMRGGDKLLEKVDGRPCLRVMADRAAEAGLTVIVTLPALDHPRAKALEGAKVQVVPVPDAAEGMSASLRRASTEIGPDTDGLMILPPDMPALTSSDITLVLKSFLKEPDRIHRGATEEGLGGHPIIFPKHLLTQFSALKGDQGAAPIVKAHAAQVQLVTLAGQKARLDLDTPEAWAAWRASCT